MHQGGRDLSMQLWTLISFELWCRTFLDSPAGRQQPTPPAGVAVTAVANA